jgi:hypothetical protein
MSQLDKLQQSLRDHYDTQPHTFSEADWQEALALREPKRRRRYLGLWVVTGLLLLTGVTATLFMTKEESTIDRQQVLATRDPHLPAPDGKKPESSFLQAGSEPSEARPVSIESSNQPKVSDQTTNEVVRASIKLPSKSPATENSLPGKNEGTDTAPSGTGLQADAGHKSGSTGAIVLSNSGVSDNPTGGTITANPAAPVNLSPGNKEEETMPTDSADHPRTSDRADLGTVTAAQQTATEVLPAWPADEDSAKATAESWPEPVTFFAATEEGLYFDAGATWLKGWSGPQGYNGRGLSPVGGFGYLKRIDRQCAFGFGLSYLRVPRLAARGKTSRISSYTFGEESKVTVITPLTAHYLQVPLRFHYRISSVHQMGGGIIFSLLQDVVATVTTYDERPGSRTNYSTAKLGRYRDGFLLYDSQLSVFYGARIFRGIVLQAEFFLGLPDVKDNTFFGVEQAERNSGASLRVIYYPFRKGQK